MFQNYNFDHLIEYECKTMGLKSKLSYRFVFIKLEINYKWSLAWLIANKPWHSEDMTVPFRIAIEDDVILSSMQVSSSSSIEKFGRLFFAPKNTWLLLTKTLEMQTFKYNLNLYLYFLNWLLTPSLPSMLKLNVSFSRSTIPRGKQYL